MNPTLQHTVIARHLDRHYGHLPCWPFSSIEAIVEELQSVGLAIKRGEYLVVCFQHTSEPFCKITQLQDLCVFYKDSVVISYAELERAFHEQYTDWVEL
jgi:hypothetical protein